MRTTVRLPDQLLAEAKQFAAASGQSLTAVIESALLTLLNRRSTPEAAAPVALETYGRGGVLPGVDLDDSAALLDLMGGLTDRADDSA